MQFRFFLGSKHEMMNKQSFNSPAITVFLTRVLRNPTLLVPDLVVKNVSSINWNELHDDHGIRYVVFDKDNTITAPYVDEIHPEVKESVQNCLQKFGRKNTVIFSNSAGTPDDVNDLWKKDLERETGLDVIKHVEKKPLGFENVLNHFGTKNASKIVVVGDRILTDTVFGNLHGSLTIHCKTPLDTRNDNKPAVFFRNIENFFVNALWRKN